MKKFILSILILFLIILSWCFKQESNNIIDPIIKKPVLPTNCIDEFEAEPVITEISTNSWIVNSKIDFTIDESGDIILEPINETLRKLFIEKYPKYADTISIKIEKQTPNHARWWITFISWAAGWYFLAAKIDNKWQIILDWNGQISCELSKYGFPEDMLFDCSEEYQIDLSYQDIINYLNYNITDIMINYSSIKPANWQWFTDWFWFTSINHVYVDYEDWHYLYRALLKCDNINNVLLCNPLAVFENQNRVWVIVQWEDTQKYNSIIHKWAVDYEWER